MRPKDGNLLWWMEQHIFVQLKTEPFENEFYFPRGDSPVEKLPYFFKRNNESKILTIFWEFLWVYHVSKGDNRRISTNISTIVLATQIPSIPTAILNELTNQLASRWRLFFTARRNVNCHGGWELQVDLHKFYETWRGDLMGQVTAISLSSWKV